METKHWRARARAQGQRLFGRDRPVQPLEPLAARIATASAHVLRERSQLREVLLDPSAHEGTRAMTAHQQPFAHQTVDGLAHGDPRDTELAREVALGRQCVIHAEDVAVHGFAQRPLQLLIQRQIARARKRANRFREARHAGPLVPERWLVDTNAIPQLLIRAYMWLISNRICGDMRSLRLPLDRLAIPLQVVL